MLHFGHLKTRLGGNSEKINKFMCTHVDMFMCTHLKKVRVAQSL